MAVTEHIIHRTVSFI